MSAASRCRPAVLAGLAALGIGAPQLFASQTVICNAVLQSDPQQAGAQFGWSVDGDDKWLVGGAPFASPGGAIVVFEGPPTASQEKAPLPPPADLQPGDRFGFSVSIHGDWLAVGAPSGDGRFVDSGVVYVFRHEGDAWRQYGGKLEADNAAPNAQFGFSVALRGGTLVVGAPHNSQRGTRAGAAYVFELSLDGIWRQSAPALHAGDARPFDLFGSSVAVDGNTLVAGAPFADDLDELLNFGAAYVFENDRGTWAQQKKLVAADTFRGGNIQFGASVALTVTPDGSRIVVGAPGDDVSGAGSGSAFVFERSGSEWIRFPLAPEIAGPGKQFGTSVDIDDVHIAVGARFDAEGGPEAGAAYLFERQTRAEKLKLINRTAGARFGQSVAILDGKVYPGGPFYLNVGAIAVCPKKGPEPVLTCKKAGPPSVAAGKTVTYTIVVKNTGDATATELKLIDPTPAGVERVSPACGKDDDNPCSLDPLGPDQSHQIEMKFRVPSITACGAAPDPVENAAEVSADGGFKAECKAAPTSIQVPRDGELACEKSGPLTATTGDLITYEITVSNKGCKEVRNVVLEDPTPDGLIFVDPPCPKPPCRLGTIQPDKPVKVEASFRVLQECRESVENIAHVTGSEGLQDTCAFKTVLEGADLAVDVPVPASIPGGEELAVPVSVLNAGPRKATKVTLKVDIEGTGSVIPVHPDCEEDPDIPGRFTCTIAEIACGGSKTLTFRVKAPDCLLCEAPPEPIQVKAKVLSATPDPDLSNNSNEAAIRVICPEIACLDIDKTDSPDPVALGHAVTYDITVTNTGTVDAEEVIVKDLAPAGLTGIVWCQGEDCQPTTPGPLVTQLDLAAGASEVFRLRGIASECGTLVNKATAEHPAGTIAEAVEETQVEGISLLCTGIDGLCAEGSLITKTFELINCGPNIQLDNPGDEFTDTLPAGLTLVSVSADSGTTGMAGNTATWNGSVGVGDTVTIEVEATIDLGTLGLLLCNQAELAADLDGNGTNETSIFADPCCCPVVPLPPIPTLSREALLVLILLLAVLTLRRLRAPPDTR